MLAAGQCVAAIAALLAAVPAWSGRVYTNRAWAIPQDKLPAWNIYAGDEEIIAQGLNFPMRLQHELTVVCHGLARAVSSVDTALDAITATALATLFASTDTTRLALGNTAMVPLRIERDLINEGEAAVGRVSLSLRVRFHTFANAPETVN